tara:strand:+ start:4663 stop:5673 length:1011 start_codon:yes stop_codon:yes gene_type:complete
MENEMSRAILRKTFVERAGWALSDQIRVAGDASNRKYDRLIRPNGETAILMDAAPELGEDVRPFIRVADYLRNSDLSAPRIFAADPEYGFLLTEDFGDALFADLMTADPSRTTALYQASMDVLTNLHHAEPLVLPNCNAAWLSDMIEPLFEWYAKDTNKSLMAGVHDALITLAEPLDHLPKVTILRDYHAQNLLWLAERQGVARVGLLDFQDAMIGHPAYDLVSILQDARRDVDAATEAAMINYFLSKTNADRTEFLRAYAVLGAQRNLRIVGIFARLCLRDGKRGYVDLIPRVWEYVQRNLAHPDMAPLAQALEPLPEPTPEFLEQLKNRCAVTH